MKSIYKYRLDPDDETVLTLRGNVLSAGVQGPDIMVWAVYDDDARERQVRVNVMGTGHDFPKVDESSFIGTVFMGVLVFHVFATSEIPSCCGGGPQWDPLVLRRRSSMGTRLAVPEMPGLKAREHN